MAEYSYEDRYKLFSQMCREALRLTKIDKMSYVPVRSGYLKTKAIYGIRTSKNHYYIVFDENVANYIPFLEEGTRPHDIPNAFGLGYLPNPYTKVPPFGVGGRFNGKFHPGSTKHVGFIEKQACLIYTTLREKYGDIKLNVSVKRN